MDKEEPESPEPLDPDPEIAVLLAFEPVVRRTRRHDGWSPRRQRGFIAALARIGDIDRAAHSVGRTASGAWKVRSSADAEGFAESWDGALDLFHARNPLLTRRGGRARPPWTPPPPELDEDEDEGEAGDGIPVVEVDELLAGLLDRYRKKLQQERECRLAGRIVEADYYVRQLTFIEIGLDLGCQIEKLQDLFRSGEIDIFRTIGTPMAVLMDRIRRDYWREKGEPDRLPPPMIAEHDDERATGHHGRTAYMRERDGDFNEWKARNARIEALQAEAQLLWEEKAKADAAAWAERVKRAEEGPGAAGAEDARG